MTLAIPSRPNSALRALPVVAASPLAAAFPAPADTAPAGCPILRNRFSPRAAAQRPRHQAAVRSAPGVQPSRPAIPRRKHHARQSAVRTCASAFPWACRRWGSQCQPASPAVHGCCRPAAWLDRLRFPVGRHTPAGGNVDRLRLHPHGHLASSSCRQPRTPGHVNILHQRPAN